MSGGALAGEPDLPSTAPYGGPLIIGHRGLPKRFPDNTLAGVLAALTAGADGVEVDVRVCADGEWVCHHDPRRGGKQIAAWDLADLRREAVPSFAEMAAAVPPERWLFVEVKPLPRAMARRRLPALAAFVAGRAAHTRVLSSSRVVLDEVGEAMPAVARSLVFAGLPAQFPDAVGLSPKHTLVERLLEVGRALHPWTVNRPTRMRELARLGVASITTNVADLAVEALRG